MRGNLKDKQAKLDSYEKSIKAAFERKRKVIMESNFSFLWYNPFVGLMVFAIILYHKMRRLALPFWCVRRLFLCWGCNSLIFFQNACFYFHNGV